MRLSRRDSLLGVAGLVGLAWYGLRRQHAASFYQGKVAVITGGSRGLGLAMARALAERGADLALLARDPEELRTAQADLARFGRSVSTWPCDLTSEDQIAAAIRDVSNFHGKIDVLINNAGEIVVGPALPLNTQEFDQMMKLHFWAPFHTVAHVLPLFRKQGGGTIINIASIGGKVAVPHLLSYTASKFALVGFSEGLQAEVAPENIRVTTVCPWVIRTGSNLNAKFKGKAAQEFAWFTATMQTPLTSGRAERVARRVIEAGALGPPVLILPWQASLAVSMHGVCGVCPNLVAYANALVKRLLPTRNYDPSIQEPLRGKSVQESSAGNARLRPSDKAAHDLHE
jgi:NAD(P)-dependent dehydrogenase (short-subunit alcohol dehydrogenase family)